METALTGITLENLAEKREGFRLIRDNFYKSLGTIFFDGIKSRFAKYPALQGICWTQYTPFISSQELETEHGTERAPSTFKANIDDFYIVFDGKIIVANERTNHEKYDLTIAQLEENEDNAIIFQIYDEIYDFLSLFDDDFYYMICRDYRIIFLDPEASYTSLYLPTLPKEVKVIAKEISDSVDEMNKKIKSNKNSK